MVPFVVPQLSVSWVKSLIVCWLIRVLIDKTKVPSNSLITASENVMSVTSTVSFVLVQWIDKERALQILKFVITLERSICSKILTFKSLRMLLSIYSKVFVSLAKAVRFYKPFWESSLPFFDDRFYLAVVKQTICSIHPWSLMAVNVFVSKLQQFIFDGPTDTHTHTRAKNSNLAYAFCSEVNN